MRNPAPDFIGATVEEIAGYFDPADWEAAKKDAITLEQVREALSGIRGSLSDTVIESREERF